MKNIAIYAEKPDVANKIAVAFGGVEILYRGVNTKVTMDNYEQYKSFVERKYSAQGYIPVVYQGNTYNITWGTGHMCSLKQAEDYNSDYKSWSKIPKPFFPEDYQIKIRGGYNYKTKRRLKVDPNAKKQLDIVKRLFMASDYIINATDDDREGELIFAYVYEYIKSRKPYKRVFLDSYTEEAIKAAFTKLKDMSEVKPVEMAGRARSIADWVVGANLTVATTLQYGRALTTGKKGDYVVSVGRVQTPTLNILVERELEILNFKPSTSYHLKGIFTAKDGSGDKYIGVANKKDYETEKEAEFSMKDLENLDATVIMYIRRDGYREAPLLYNLSSLSVDANSQHGMTAKQTLDTAQSLYTKGLLTYPRTSSAYLPEDMKESMHDVLDKLSSIPEFDEYIKRVPRSSRRMTKRHYDSSKVESHYAIVPTNKVPDLLKLSVEERNIYTLVAQSVIKSIFPPAKIQSTKIETQVGDEIFYTSGNVTIDETWMAVNPGASRENELPVLKEGDIVDHNLSIDSKTTRAPNRYTDSSLITAMLTAGKRIEDKDLREFMSTSGDGGIGTDATRAGIIETVISRGYAKRQKKHILPTKKGMKLIKTLPIEDLKSPELTAQWESRLNDIQNNKDTLDHFIADLEEQTKIWVKEVLKTNMDSVQNQKQGPVNTGLRCPNCGSEIVENDKGFFCSSNERDNPHSCQFKAWKSSDRFSFTPDLDVNDIAAISRGELSGEKNGVSRAGNSFPFKLRLSDDRQGTEHVYPKREQSQGGNAPIESEFICPVCGDNLHHIKNDEKGWNFYSCRGHVTVGADFFGTPLTNDDIRRLLLGEVVGPLTLHGNYGEYEGHLQLDMVDGKVKRVKQ